MYMYVCMYVCMGIASPVWWPGMAHKVSMEFKMAFNHKFLPALEEAEKLMKDLDLGNACNVCSLANILREHGCDCYMYVCMNVCMYVSMYVYVCVCV